MCYWRLYYDQQKAQLYSVLPVKQCRDGAQGHKSYNSQKRCQNNTSLSEGMSEDALHFLQNNYLDDFKSRNPMYVGRTVSEVNTGIRRHAAAANVTKDSTESDLQAIRRTFKDILDRATLDGVKNDVRVDIPSTSTLDIEECLKQSTRKETAIMRRTKSLGALQTDSISEHVPHRYSRRDKYELEPVGYVSTLPRRSASTSRNYTKPAFTPSTSHRGSSGGWT